MNPGWGQAPRAPEAPPRDLAKHHEQAPPGPNKLGCTQLGNQTRLTHYVETRTRQAPQPLTKTSYEGVCVVTRRVECHSAHARGTEPLVGAAHYPG